MERQLKSVLENHYMEGFKQSQFVDHRRSVLNSGMSSPSK